MKKVNRRIVVSERPRYTIPNANVFSLTEQPVPEARDEQILIRTTWVGVDSYLFGRVKRVSPYAEPVAIGDVMVGAAVGRVEVSNHPDYAAGDLVHGFWGWQDWYVSDGSDVSKVDPEIPRPSYMLGAFGVPGLGAYVAVNELVKVQPGETLTIGSALGGLGQMVGQIAKLKGARVVGGVSGPEKRRIALEQLGYDACLDRKGKDFLVDLKAAYAKHGIDCYVMAGGNVKVLEVAMPYFNRKTRIAICGMMNVYGLTTLPPGPDRTMVLLNEVNLRRLEIRGLIAQDWIGTSLHEQFTTEMKAWILGGKIKPIEHVVEGLEKAPDTLQGLFEGKSIGKAVVRVSD